MESLLQDLRFGCRILLRSPAISLAVVVALTLGIGANSAMFSIVDALLLHPLHFRDPEQLMVIQDRDPAGAVYSASAADYIDWRKQSKSFSDLAGWWPASFVITGGDRPLQIAGATATSNFFHALEIKPTLGRTFLPDEDGIDNPGSASKVAIISNKLWQETFGADPNILGKPIRLNSTSYAIVGVLPPEFQFVWRNYQAWIPITLDRDNRDYHGVRVVGRLKAPRPVAAAELRSIGNALAEQYPKSDKGWQIEMSSFQESLVNGTLRARVLLLFGAVGLILLIACANVANLLLARSAARHREIAVRLSLGATRGRLMRQLLTEAVLLSSLGGAAGLALAWSLVRILPSVVPTSVIPSGAQVELNQLVVIYTILIAVATGVLFGMAPALTSTRPDMQQNLKEGSRGATSGRGRQRLRQILIVGEIAFALMLAASAGLMIKSLVGMYTLDLGFDSKNVLTLRLFLPAAKYDAAASLRYHKQAMERIAALPGVETVAIGSHLPLQTFRMEVPFDLESSPPRDQGERPGVGYITVSDQYLATLRIPIKRGRGFTARDDATAPPVVLVNETFAQKYFPNENPVGKRVLLNRPVFAKSAFEDTIYPEIVGVIGDVKGAELGAPVPPYIYSPHAQNPWITIGWIVIRTAIDPATLTSAVRRELTQMDKDQPIAQLGSMQQMFETRFAEPGFQTIVMGSFALLALILAVVGIYGVNAYAVMQRRNEIGLRMALGATPGQVVGEILKQGMRLTAIGVAIGLAGAYAIASVVKSVLVGVSATDPLTLLAVALLLTSVAALACYLPARKATHIDPAIALRQE